MNTAPQPMAPTRTQAWRWRRWSLGLKLAVSTFALVTIAFVVFVGALTYAVSDVIERRAGEEIREKTRLLVSLVDASDKDLRARTQALAHMFESSLEGTFELRPATITVDGHPTPTLLRNGKPLNLDTARVDAFTATSGAVVTVFARTGDDFVRITTSLTDPAGTRALGTLLDRAHPGYAAVHAGGSYTGLATLFGREYMTQYDPIRSADGDVIGLRFVGLDFSERLISLKAAIRGATVGKTGYFYVLDARPGPGQGTLVVHPASEGKNILGSRAPDGREFIKEIIANQDGLIRYPWINSERGETEPREKLVAYSSFKSWGWVIGGGTYVDEYVGAVHRLRDEYALGAAVVVLLLSGGMYLLMRVTVVRPLGQVRVAAEAIAQGDLTIALQTEREDEVGELIHAINQIGEGLTRVVRAVRDSSETVATACSQLAQGNQDLSDRTEGQASALTETASSMDTLGATVVQNASGATQANALARGASEVAARGGALVTDVVDTMKGINEASHQIADIIGVIDGVALQTNILALNAAVEAARAGAAGQGFAVVAAEVRTLAVRSADAAKQIKHLIDTSVARVAKGSTLVNQAGATMVEVVSSIRRVTHIMGDISAASTEQTANVTRVGSAVSQMDASTQQSAALVTQMAAAATTLRTQAEDLVSSVAAFKLAAVSRAA